MRVPRPFVLLLVLGLLGLAGCSSESGEAAPTAEPGSSGVEVSGDTDQAPEITIPDQDPPEDLVVQTLVEGDGPEVQAGDLLLADYVGVLWEDGEEFDSSWSRGEPAAFGIGVGQVIEGWDTGLVGQTVGSRVLLVIPPDLGYGDQESESIPAGSTLVFVVDIRDTFSAEEAAGGTPVDNLPEGLPTVSGEPGSEPTVAVQDAQAPATSSSVVVVEGAGEAIDPEATVVAHASQVSYDTGEVVASTWDTAPVAIDATAIPGLAEAIVGASVGTRVLSLIAAEDDPSGQGQIVVLDVLGSF